MFTNYYGTHKESDKSVFLISDPNLGDWTFRSQDISFLVSKCWGGGLASILNGVTLGFLYQKSARICQIFDARNVCKFLIQVQVIERVPCL